MKRSEIASHVVYKLRADEERLRRQFASTGPIQKFFIDDVLPVDFVMRIRDTYAAQRLEA